MELPTPDTRESTVSGEPGADVLAGISHEQEDVFDLVYFKHKNYVEKKTESIYWTYADESSNEKSGPAQGNKAQDGTA